MGLCTKGEWAWDGFSGLHLAGACIRDPKNLNS